MAKAQPIKDLKNIEQMKQYFRDKKEWRNYALFIMGLNTALRISDLLKPLKSFSLLITILSYFIQFVNTLRINNCIKMYSLYNTGSTQAQGTTCVKMAQILGLTL